MRLLVALLCLALLQACARQPGTPNEDCDVARAQFPTCFDRHIGDGDFEAMWYACIPHSAPQRINGSWSTDFEWNAFFEGREPTLGEAFSVEEAYSLDSLRPELAFRSGVEPPPVIDGKARVWRLEFLGRRQTCHIYPNIRPVIYVEEIRHSKLLREVPGYPEELPSGSER